MTKYRWNLGALAMALVAAGCDSDDGVEPRPLCTGFVEVAATRESRPLFTWSPNCAVARLWVGTAPVLGQSQEVAWEIRGGASGIVSGVRYGAVPRGATEEIAANFQPFAQLHVAVYNADGDFLGGAPLERP